MAKERNLSRSWAEYEERCETAYNLRKTERLTYREIGGRFGVSQQMGYRYYRFWRDKLLRENMMPPGPPLPVSRPPPPPLPVPNSISEFTKNLGYTDKPFHTEWYEYASMQRRFLLLAPRSHAKSTCMSVNYPIWRIIKDPNVRILLVSNTDSQARRFVYQVKNNLERYFPFVVPENRETWNRTEFVVKRDNIQLKDPTLSSIGVNGAILSRRCDLIILDDVVDKDNSATEEQRDKIYEWLRETLLPALEPNGQIVIIGTTFGPDDLYARLQRDKWPFRRYDAIVDETNKTALWPERVPFECQPQEGFAGFWNRIEGKNVHEGMCCLTEIKHILGSTIFNAQYRCDPSGYAGQKLKPEWLKPYYRTLPDKLDEIVLGVDPAITERTGGDYFAIATLGYSERENIIYVMDFFRAHLTFPEQLAAIVEYWRLKKANRIIIEANIYQKALAQGVQGMGLPVIPYRSVKDKTTRIMNISPYFENHTIRVKEDMDDFLHEYVQFDKGEHDDLLDALTLAVTDIIDRNLSSRVNFTSQIALTHVFKSRIPETVQYPTMPGTQPEPPEIRRFPKPLSENGYRELCLTCGRAKGSECKGH